MVELITAEQARTKQKRAYSEAIDRWLILINEAITDVTENSRNTFVTIPGDIPATVLEQLNVAGYRARQSAEPGSTIISWELLKNQKPKD